MQITATEFKANISKYLSMASAQDIFITKYGQTIALLTKPTPDRIALLDSLVGIASGSSTSPDELKKERLKDA